MRRWGIAVVLMLALAGVAAPARADAAVLTIAPKCVKASDDVVHGVLYGAFNWFGSPDAGFAIGAQDSSGNYVDITYSNLQWGFTTYTFDFRLAAGLPPGDYTVTAYGSRPPPEGDSKVLRVQPACDSVVMGRADYANPGDGFSTVSGNVKRASPFVTFRAARVRKIGVYLDGRGSNTGKQRVRGVLYANAQGKPAQRLGQTFDFDVPAGMLGQWVELFMAPPVQIPPGVYWLGLYTEPVRDPWGATTLARYAWVSKPVSRRFNVDVYGDGPSATFGDSLSDDQLISVYAAGSF